MPSGRLAFFFTDIVGSTSRWERFPNAMKDALLLHDGIVRDAIERNGGRVFKTVGDAFCAVFETVPNAIAASLDVQRGLAGGAFEAVGGLAVRVAIHVGRSEERDDDYFGATVNRVARVLAIAHGGQIVVTAATAEDVGEALPPGVALVDLGEHRLRDLKQPERIAQIVSRDLPAEFPPLLSLSAYTNNLPLQLTELIGRRDEIAAIRAMLRETRLVTVTGTGGVGKTRVALQIAAELTEHFRDGAWFVDLAPLQEPTYVRSAFGIAVGLPEPPGGLTLAALVAHLREKRLLLVVDNCEHVLDTVSHVLAAIVAGCPDVVVLATSRERLAIAGERVYALPSLRSPPPDTVTNLMQYDAYAFFVDRASAALPTFAPNERERLLVSEICRLLDGIPYAIELAAARSRVLSLAQIVERLDERLRFLTTSDRSASPRRQTIRAMIDWTYDSLGDRERELFVRLSVFAGGFSLEAVEAVCASGSLPADDVIDVFAALLEKSLVFPDVARQSTRFNMHETTKAYALEKLIERGGRDETVAAHASWIADLLTKQDPTAGTGTVTHRFLQFAFPENGNVRAALGWAMLPSGDRNIASKIAAHAARMWYDAGLIAEGTAWIESLLADIDETREPERAASLWMGMARLTVAKRSAEAAGRGLALYERLGDARGIAHALVRLTFNYYQTRSMDLAQSAIERALTLLRRNGFAETVLYADALDVCGNLLLNLERFDDARSSFEDALRLFIMCGEELGAARVRGNLAELCFATGRHHDAIRYVDLAAETFHRLKSTTRECMALVNLAGYRLALEEFDAAEAAAHVAIRMARRLADAQLLAIAVQHVACIEASRGNHDEAAVLIGYVDAWFRTEGYEREWSEARQRAVLIAALAANLTPEWLERALTIGATLGAADVTSRALESRPLTRSGTASEE